MKSDGEIFLDINIKLNKHIVLNMRYIVVGIVLSQRLFGLFYLFDSSCSGIV